MPTLYGISNCDTVRKARRWCDEHGTGATFHDFRKDGLTQERVDSWLTKIDWSVLLNKRGTTWRKLPDDVRDTTTEANVAELIVKHPALIKRPVLELGEELEVGFKPERYAELFNQ